MNLQSLFNRHIYHIFLNQCESNTGHATTGILMDTCAGKTKSAGQLRNHP